MIFGSAQKLWKQNLGREYNQTTIFVHIMQLTNIYFLKNTQLCLFLIYSLWLVNIIDKVCKCIWFLSTFKEIVKTILWLQEWPIQPGLHPESHTPLTWLHPAHVPLQFSEQSWPNKPFVQADEIKGHILSVFFKYVSEIYFFNQPAYVCNVMLKQYIYIIAWLQ